MKFRFQIIENLSTILAVLAIVLSFSLPSIRKWIGIDDDIYSLSYKIEQLNKKISEIEDKRNKDVCRLSYIDKSLIRILNEENKNNALLFKSVKADDFTITNMQIKSNESISDISNINNKTTQNTDCGYN